MSIKMIAVDIDGTLVTGEKKILPETKEAIFKFIDNGGIFVIASGRPSKGIDRYIDELELRERGGYIISYNGSRVINLKTNEIVDELDIPVNYVDKIIKCADKCGVPLTTYKGDIAVTQKAHDNYFNLEVSINKLDVEVVADLKKELTYPVPKFLITGEPERLEQAEKYMCEQLKDLTVFRSEPFFLEIAPNGVDKGNALKNLSKYLNIDISETMACGDGFNDVTLIKTAGIGVAMKNAQKPVKNIADFITLSNEENGVGFAINKFAV